MRFLAATRGRQGTALPEEFGIDRAITAADLYAEVDWLDERKEGIQGRLARHWIAEGDRVLRDLSSTGHEGGCCPLARSGDSRDRRRGHPQVHFGLLCDRDGRTVRVSVYPDLSPTG